MPKRSFWTIIGYSAGVASSMAVRRKLRRAVVRYSPAGLGKNVGKNLSAKGSDAVDRARQFTIDLRTAATDGRRAMREREAELDDEFSLPRNHLR